MQMELQWQYGWARRRHSKDHGRDALTRGGSPRESARYRGDSGACVLVPCSTAELAECTDITCEHGTIDEPGFHYATPKGFLARVHSSEITRPIL